MKRQFSSGSRQAPDPLDKFLEKHNFYRKHTARDASCLFRVVSEQVYDTQLHHLEIRKRCVMYMRKHRELFQQHIKRDIDDYLDDMSKPKTYGTLIELQAAGFLFQRNVIIFEPFNLGTLYISRPNFENDLRVFHTPERHFDSVYTLEFIKDVAVCQSLCYEILYKDFFKIPDVSYAVERMLHQSTFDIDHYEEYNEYGYSTRMNLQDGQSFNFDLPNETNCILENYKLCHFHNKNFSCDLQRQLKDRSDSNIVELDKNSVTKSVESALGLKYVSCVRQLLEEGITPFPYKVAKALDPSMYRNIEFDSWNEARKESKLQNWYNGDNNFKVGAKCNVKLRNSENDLYTCHIQEMSQDKGCCVVFVEQLGEKRVVSYDALTPLPPEQFKPWTLPYRFQRNMQKCNSYRFMRHYNCRWKFNRHPSISPYCSTPLPSADCDNLVDDNNKKMNLNNFYKLKELTNLEHFPNQSFEYCTMPITVENSTTNFTQPKSMTVDNLVMSSNISNANDENEHVSTQSAVVDENFNNIPNAGVNSFELKHTDGIDGDMRATDLHCIYPIQSFGGGMNGGGSEDLYDGNCYPQSTVVAIPKGGTLYYMYNNCNSIPNVGNGYIQCTQSPMTIPTPHPQALLNTPSLGPMPNCFYYPSTPYCTTNADSLLYQPIQQTNEAVTFSNVRVRNSATLGGKINYDARKSVRPNGVDLPDLATLRYFYNLGIDFYHMKQKKNSNSSLNTDEMTKLNSEIRNLKVEEIPVQEHNTPDNNLTNANANSVHLTQNIAHDQKTTVTVKQAKYNTNHYQRRHLRERYNHNNHNMQRANINDNIKMPNESGGGQQDVKNNIPTKMKNNVALNTKYNEVQSLQEFSNNGTKPSQLPPINGYEISQVPPSADMTQMPPNAINNYGSNECAAYELTGRSANNCIPMPLTPCQPPYGFYQPPPPGITSAATSSAYVPSPTALTNFPVLGTAANAINSGFYSSPHSTMPDIGVENRGDVSPGMHYQYVSYPPPLPLFCTNLPGNVAGTNVTVSAPHMTPQSFWCLPPPPNTPTPLSQPTIIRNTTNKSGGNNVPGLSYTTVNAISTDPATNT